MRIFHSATIGAAVTLSALAVGHASSRQSPSTAQDLIAAEHRVTLVPEFPRLDLEAYVASSSSIVLGRVTGQEHFAPSNSLPFTSYRIAVTHTVVGEAHDDVEVRIYGGAGNGFQLEMSGAPDLEVGEESLFFLQGPWQGSFGILGLSDGRYALSGWEQPGNGLIQGLHAPAGTRAIEFIGRIVDIHVQQTADRQQAGEER